MSASDAKGITPWRVGRKALRTLYDANDRLIGVVDTPDMATLVVEAVNAYWGTGVEPKVFPKVALAAPPAGVGAEACRTCKGQHAQFCSACMGSGLAPSGGRLLETLKPKPRTTVKRFAADLKARIERAAKGFDQPGQDGWVGGARYILGVVDAALSDYDVRDPEDFAK